jgi:hypothetical protein
MAPGGRDFCYNRCLQNRMGHIGRIRWFRSSEEKIWHISAVIHAFSKWIQEWRGKSAQPLVRSNNVSVVQYINHQRETVSLLCRLALQIWHAHDQRKSSSTHSGYSQYSSRSVKSTEGRNLLDRMLFTGDSCTERLAKVLQTTQLWITNCWLIVYRR